VADGFSFFSSEKAAFGHACGDASPSAGEERPAVVGGGWTVAGVNFGFVEIRMKASRDKGFDADGISGRSGAAPWC